MPALSGGAVDAEVCEFDMSGPSYCQVNRLVRAQPKPLPPLPGTAKSLLGKEARTAAVRCSGTPWSREGRGRIGERKKRVHECAPFDCFWKESGCNDCH